MRLDWQCEWDSGCTPTGTVSRPGVTHEPECICATPEPDYNPGNLQESALSLAKARKYRFKEQNAGVQFNLWKWTLASLA